MCQLEGFCPRAQLSGAQLSSFSGRTVGPRGPTVLGPNCPLFRGPIVRGPTVRGPIFPRTEYRAICLWKMGWQSFAILFRSALLIGGSQLAQSLKLIGISIVLNKERIRSTHILLFTKIPKHQWINSFIVEAHRPLLKRFISGQMGECQ